MAALTFDDLMVNKVPPVFEWWFGLFGITDSAHVTMGTTIVSSVILLFLIYLALSLLFGFVVSALFPPKL